MCTLKECVNFLCSEEMLNLVLMSLSAILTEFTAWVFIVVQILTHSQFPDLQNINYQTDESVEVGANKIQTLRDRFSQEKVLV